MPAKYDSSNSSKTNSVTQRVLSYLPLEVKKTGLSKIVQQPAVRDSLPSSVAGMPIQKPVILKEKESKKKNND
jgi:hypothetical protein